MVTGNDHFMEMREGVEPSNGCLQLLKRSGLGEISGVNQKIAVWNLWLGVVRI